MSIEEENTAHAGNNNFSKCFVEELKNDSDALGQSLIKFMNLATGSVKTALQKPANYKKNINHRRYLQKQLKICSRRKKRTNKTKTGPKTKKAVSGKKLGDATQVWFGQQNCEEIYVGNGDFPSHHLPLEVSFNGLQARECYFQNFTNQAKIQNGYSWNHDAYSSPERASGLGQTENNSTVFRDDLILPDIFEEETEQFLTGEELTNALDIKDLFVPDKYPCTFDKNMSNSFQTVPSTASILSW